MIYVEDIMAYQSTLFVKALALGALLGFCYDCLRVIRTVIKFGKKLFIVSDFVFCLWAGFLIFSFLLNENFGLARFYIYLAISIGFGIWYFTLGRLNVFAAKILRKIILWLLRPIKAVFLFLCKKAIAPIEKIKIFLTKIINLPKNTLKKIYGIVYNILCLNILKAFSVCGGKVGKEHQGFESSGREKTEKGNDPENRSYRLRGVYVVFDDLHPGEHKQQTHRT